MRVGGRFALGGKIGSGTYAEVFRGTDIRTGEEVALKVQAMGSKLHVEANVCRQLAGVDGIPKVHWFGVESNQKVLVMSLLGPSLEDVFNTCGRSFDRMLVRMLAGEMVSRAEALHRRGFVHCDVKPDNFALADCEGSTPVHVIDFGLTQTYLDPETKEHVPHSVGDSFMGIGTASFASIHAHEGVRPSRRDDLEAIGNMLVYFLKGSLPWQGLEAPTIREQLGKMRAVKFATPLKALCEGLPEEFATYLSYCRGLSFEEDPDYEFLRGLFRGKIRNNQAHAGSNIASQEPETGVPVAVCE